MWIYKKNESLVHKNIFGAKSITGIKRINTEIHLPPEPTSGEHPKHK